MSCAKKRTVFFLIIVLILSLSLLLVACNENLVPPAPDTGTQDSDNDTDTTDPDGGKEDDNNEGNENIDPTPKPQNNTRGLIFELNEDSTGYVVTGYNGSSREIVILNTYNGKPVTSIANGAFEGEDGITKVTVSDGIALGAGIFEECDNLKEVVLPSDLTEIPEGTFYSCLNLKTVVIPETVTKISELAFVYCMSLNNISLPQGLKEIGEGAFGACYNLTEITIPASVETIDESAFAFTPKLVHVTNLSGVEITVTSTLSPEIRTDETTEFTNKIVDDGKVVTYTVDEKVYLLQYEKEGHIFDIAGYGITDIPSCAVTVNNNLTEMTIPEGVKSISESAFYFCGNVLTLNLPSSLETVEANAFGLRKLVHVTNLSAVEVDFDNITENEGFEIRTSIETDFTCPITTTESGVLLLTVEEDVYLVGYIGESGTLVVPEEVTAIPTVGIYYNEKIKVIDFSECDYCSIYEDAIYNNPSLEKVIINGNYLYKSAFYNNRSLSQIEIKEEFIQNEHSFEKFVNCAREVEIILSATKKETDIIATYEKVGFDAYMVRCSDGVKYVSYDKLLYSFSEENGGYFILDGCFDVYLSSSANFKTATVAEELFGYPVTKIATEALPVWRNSNYVKTVIIPSSVTEIEEHAFVNCNQLTKVIYKGTKAQWDKVIKGTNWWGETTPEFECDDDSFILAPTPNAITVAEDSSEYATVNLSKTSGLNGETFTFTVTVTEGYDLVSVTVNDKTVTPSYNNTYSATVEGDTTVKVTTEVTPPVYTIGVSPESSPYATVSDFNKTSAPQGAVFQFTVRVAEGYEIAEVKVNNRNAYFSNQGDGWVGYYSTVDGNTLVKVITRAIDYSISVALDSSENATVKLGATSGTQGETFTFTVKVLEGYEIESVTVNGISVNEESGVYTGTVHGNTTVKVVTKEEATTVEFEDGEFRYIYDKKEDYCTIKSYVGNGNYISLPGTCYYNGVIKEVRKVADEAFRFNDEIYSVEISSLIAEIGENAFADCMNLNTVILYIQYSESLTIKSGAFANLFNLMQIEANGNKSEWESKVTLEEGWNSGSEKANIRCNDGEIYFDFTLNGFTFHFVDEQKAYEIKKYVGDETTVIIPSFVEGSGLMINIIGEGAFKDNANLVNVQFEYTENLRIEASAFENCENLTSISVQGIRKIGANAFNGCTSLTEIYFQNMYVSDWNYVEREEGWNNGMEHIKFTFNDGNSIYCDGSFQFKDFLVKMNETGDTCTIVKYMGTAQNCTLPYYVYDMENSYFATTVIVESNAFADSPSLSYLTLETNGGSISYAFKEDAFIGADIIAIYYDSSRNGWENTVTTESGWTNGLPSNCSVKFTDFITSETETVNVYDL